MQVTGRAGIPANAQAAAINLTATSTAGPGWFAVWPCGLPQPGTSNVNFVGGQSVANLAAVALGAGGKLCVATSITAAIIVDVTGWWGPAGLGYVPPGVASARLLDTRPAGVAAGGVVAVAVPAGIAVATLNLTVTGPAGLGWVTAWPCGLADPSHVEPQLRRRADGGRLRDRAARARRTRLHPQHREGEPDRRPVRLDGGTRRGAAGTSAAGCTRSSGATRSSARPMPPSTPTASATRRGASAGTARPGWTSCAKIDIVGKARAADVGDFVYDCSGFVVAAFLRAGVDLVKLNAGWSDMMFRSLPRVAATDLQTGDLLLFGPGDRQPGRPDDPRRHVPRRQPDAELDGWLRQRGVCTSTVDWSRVAAIARPPFAGAPAITQAARLLDPYAGAE